MYGPKCSIRILHYFLGGERVKEHYIFVAIFLQMYVNQQFLCIFSCFVADAYPFCIIIINTNFKGVPAGILNAFAPQASWHISLSDIIVDRQSPGGILT